VLSCLFFVPIIVDSVLCAKTPRSMRNSIPRKKPRTSEVQRRLDFCTAAAESTMKCILENQFES